LECTTRGLGFAIACCFERYASVRAPPIAFDPLSVFRISHVQLAFKYHLMHRNSSPTYSVGQAPEHYQHELFPRADLMQWVQVAHHSRENFKPIVRILNSFGSFQKHITYHPLIRASITRNVVSPYYVTFGSMRQIVVALANNSRGFEDLNSIPGAIYRNGQLTNSDAIMPRNYTVDQFRSEYAAFSNYLRGISSRQLCHDTMMTSGNGSSCQLVSTSGSTTCLNDWQLVSSTNEFYAQPCDFSTLYEGCMSFNEHCATSFHRHPALGGYTYEASYADVLRTLP